MSVHDDGPLPLTFTTRDASKPFRDSTGRMVPPRSRAPLLYGSDGAPRMDERMEAYIAEPHERVARRGDLPAPLALSAAWAKLQVEEPRLAAAVAATAVQGLTVREAAPGLGVCFKTVATRANAGVAQLAIWTALPECNVRVVTSQLAGIVA